MDTSYREDVKALLDEILIGIPGVKASKAFGYPCYKVSGRIFCFVSGDAVQLKLPARRVESLVAEGGPYHKFGPVEGTTWREWVALEWQTPADYEQAMDLFIESIEYVRGGS